MPRVTLGDRLETLAASPYLPKGKREFDKRHVKKKRDWYREKARFFRKTS